jgi:hypothetical protein
MISPKNIDYFELDKIISGEEIVKEGLYYTHYNSYRYYREGCKNPLWILDISGQEAFISILYGKSLQKMVDKENFIDYVKEFSPSVIEWVLFNIDSIKCIR